MHKLLLIAILTLSACAASQTTIQTSVAQTEASYTSTSSPTPTLTFTPTFSPTPTRTPTPDDTETPIPKSYIEEYIYYLDQWLDGYKAWEEATRKISSGEEKITDTEYQEKIQSILRDMYRAADHMARLTPTSPELQFYQDWAGALRSETGGFSSLFIPGLLGNEIATQGALSHFKALNEAFNKISDKLISDGFVTVK